MNFTQTTHFVGEINLPNATSASEYALDALEIDITKYESNYLTLILGYETAKDLITTMLVTSPPTSGIWYDLANGKEFTDSLGRLNKWIGFTTIGYNPIANYVFDSILRNNVSSTTGIGEQKANISNGTAVGIKHKTVIAWNAMVDLNYILHDFLTVNATDYPDYLGITEENKDLFHKISNYF